MWRWSRVLPEAGQSLKELRQDVFAREGTGKTGGKPPGLDSAEDKGRPPMAEAATQTAPKESFAALLDESLGTEDSLEGKVLRGTIIAIEGDTAVIDVGLKSEGRVALKEFADAGQMPEQIGSASCRERVCQYG